ncbi:hypothetical protein [Flavobacterium sp. C3NV]|uniref:hypothetical protein n=1 Tax=Flavobacterium sp. C3NV TaxID=3393358 RepID=UPI00398FEE1C
MKLYIYFLFIILKFSAFSQERKTTELDTIRHQGYLILETNGINKNDIPSKFLFIPTGDIEGDLKISFIKNSQPNYNDLYIPTPYIFNDNDLFELNIFRKKFTDYKEEIKLNQSLVSKDLLNKCKILYKFKDNSIKSIKTFKIIYLDGLWLKLKIPKKNASLFLENYNKVRLNKKGKKDYEYYFLIETKVISYDVLFVDDSIQMGNVSD